MLNLEKTSNLGQKFASLKTLLYHKLLPAIAGFIQVHQFLTSLFIDNVKSDDLYVVWQANDPNNTRLWLTPYLMVWDWRVSRAGPMPFCWPSCSLLFCLQLFSLSLLFLYRLAIVWGWGLRTERVSISLSQPCIANLF